MTLNIRHRGRALVVATVLAFASPAAANDATAEIGAGGLQLVYNSAIEMVAENLYVSADEVRVALASLTHVQREALELAYFGGLTQSEIAERTGTPLGTVKSRMRLGLLAMREMLSP